MLRLFSLTALLATASAYPGGAPDVACSNLTPQHAGATTQDAMASPFQVYVHGDKVAAYIYANNSEPVRIVLKKTNADAVDFKGFLCTAETAGQQRQGYFTSESNLAKTACLSKDGITHSSSALKREIVVLWHAPAAPYTSDKVEIWCTFVQTQYVFWKWMKGDNDIKVNVPKPTTAPLPTISNNGATMAVGGQTEPTTATGTTTSSTLTVDVSVPDVNNSTTKAPEETNKTTTEKTTHHDHEGHQHKPINVKTGQSRSEGSMTAVISWCLLMVAAAASLL